MTVMSSELTAAAAAADADASVDMAEADETVGNDKVAAVLGVRSQQ